jgi:hypothetical protein
MVASRSAAPTVQIALAAIAASRAPRAKMILTGILGAISANACGRFPADAANER